MSIEFSIFILAIKFVKEMSAREFIESALVQYVTDLLTFAGSEAISEKCGPRRVHYIYFP